MEEMLKKYEDNLAGSHAVYVPMVRRFLKDCRGNFSRRAVESHLNRLRSEGYSDGTIDVVFRALRRFYRVNNLEWPFRRGEGPVVREMEVFAPALAPEVVRAMIAAARSGVLTAEEAAHLALSTTYGLRRTEMAQIAARNVDLKNRLLFVETAKHGRQRYHLIPEEILPYLEAYDFPPRSLTYLTLMYYSIEKKAGLPRMKEVGWHSIRRILDRLLIDAHLPPLTVMDFLRWKRSDRSMVARYYSVTVVGTEMRIEMDRADRDVDLAVFAVHPFLPAWRGDHAEE